MPLDRWELLRSLAAAVAAGTAGHPWAGTSGVEMGPRRFRSAIDRDPTWIERAAFDDSEGRPFVANKRALTTEHDHYSQHESIRYASARSGCGVRYVPLYDDGATANREQIVARLARGGAITPKTGALGVTWVHSSTGVNLPLPETADMVARANRGRAAPDLTAQDLVRAHRRGNHESSGRDRYRAPRHPRAARVSRRGDSPR
jgi:hypothetical protein